MATTRLMPLHIGKGRKVGTAIRDILDYVENPLKTDNGRLIIGYGCDTRVADEQFTLAKRQYEHITGRSQGQRNVIAYHTRQSFLPGEVTAEQAGEIGRELAMRFTKGKQAFIVCTHTDKSHTHNHIIFNSTTLDCTKKFRNFWGSYKAVRRLSDQICIENGLSVIENPKPSRGHYGTWLGDKKAPSFSQQLRQKVDAALAMNPADFDAFLKGMEAQNVEVGWRGKQLKFCLPSEGQQRPIRCDTLKGDYTQQAIRERIEGVRVMASAGGSAMENPAEKVNLLIDIQAKMQAGKGPGFERWAKVHNLKEMAKTLNYLIENNMADYAVLEEKAKAAAVRFNDLSGRIKAVEARLGDISALQKSISTYSRTREVYRQYREAGYSKKFLVEHEGDIALHRAAKKTFDAQGLKKLPTIKALQQEYATLAADKKKLYAGYKQAKDEMRVLATSKANVDRILAAAPGGREKDVRRR